MKAPVRPILTLPERSLVNAADDDRVIEVATYDLLLPCRRYHIEHKVAVLGRVSLTAEFLLRLVKSLEGISEHDAAVFFGFDLREMSYVLNEVVELGFVDRREGRLWLTMEGHSLFRAGSPQPQIFDVEKRESTVGFDLMSLAPQEARYLEDFEFRLPELRILDSERASSATSRVRVSFKHFYMQMPTRKDPVSATMRSLYSIDSVAPRDRFFSPVRLIINATGLLPTVANINLDEWRPQHEQDERPEVMEALPSFIDSLTVSKRKDDKESYQCLADFASSFLKDFIRSDGFNVERYYREALSRKGEPRADRPTITSLGSIFLRDNVRRLAEVLKYGLKSTTRPRHMLWIAPQTPYWGATRTLPEVLREFSSLLSKADSERETTAPTSICLVPGRGAFYLEKAFDCVLPVDVSPFPRALEILLIPGILVAISVHAPIGAQNGLAVPLGLISFDRQVVDLVADYVSARIGPFLPNEMHDDVMADIIKAPEVSSALENTPFTK